MLPHERRRVVLDLYRRHRSVERVASALGVPLRTLQRSLSSTPGLREAIEAERARGRVTSASEPAAADEEA
jgi:hypothetical protein